MSEQQDTATDPYSAEHSWQALFYNSFNILDLWSFTHSLNKNLCIFAHVVQNEQEDRDKSGLHTSLKCTENDRKISVEA